MTDFQIVEVDETRDWSDEIRKQVGKIYTVYLYDKSATTNCAELTPSYELITLYYTTEFAPHKYSEKVEETIQETFSKTEDPIVYMHCSDVAKLIHADVSQLTSLNKRVTGRTSKFYQDLVEEVTEYFTCNHII